MQIGFKTYCFHQSSNKRWFCNIKFHHREHSVMSAAAFTVLVQLRNDPEKIEKKTDTLALLIQEWEAVGRVRRIIGRCEVWGVRVGEERRGRRLTVLFHCISLFRTVTISTPTLASLRPINSTKYFCLFFIKIFLTFFL